MSDSFCKRLVDSFESRADKVAMRVVGDESEVYTFGRSLTLIRSVAWRLEQEGVQLGDRVALVGENHPSWAIAYLAILYRGAVCVPMDPHGETATLANFIENSEAKLAFVGDESLAKFELIRQCLGGDVPKVVWSTPRSPVSVSEDEKFNSWVSTSFPEEFAKAEPKPT